MNIGGARGLLRLLTAVLVIGGALLWAPDVQTQGGGQPPAVVSQSPLQGTTGVAPSIKVTATFSEAIQAQTIVFELRNSVGTLVSSSVTYDATRRTVVLDPATDLGVGQYNATVSAALDLSGTPLPMPITWTFTVATTGFQDPVVWSGLEAPTAIQFASDGRVFVAEKRGVIQVFDGLSDATPTQFADLRTNVHDFGGRGLLGMMLDPAFPTRPYLYVLYAHDALIGGTAPRWGLAGSSNDPCPDAATTGCSVSARLSRLQVSGSQMVGAEQVLVEDWFQQFPTQSIGDLVFGPDGSLYASAGDGASVTFIDSGQTANPSPDPANQGGALRSQDLRTPADPVTLSGAIIRVNPDTGLPPARNTSMAFIGPVVDANGVKSYDVTSVFQGSTSTTVRVLQPANPAPGKPHRLMYVLPVEVGVTTLGSQYSDGLEELRLLDVPNRFNVTLIAPSFIIEPWYGDHATDLDRRLESFIVNDLVPFGDTFAQPGEMPQRWIIGFSKSGNGALTLLMRHPHVFSAAAAWDAPTQFTNMSVFPGMVANFGTEANFDRYEIPTLVVTNGEAFKQRNRIWISGDQAAWTSHMIQLDQQMDQAALLHTFVQGGTRVHSWSSGWLDGAVQALDADSGSTNPIDLNAQRIVAYGVKRPSRMAFRPGTSEMWSVDSAGSLEEINRIANAADGTLENFGWPCYQGGATGPYTSAGLAICQDLVSQSGAVTAPFLTYATGQALFSGDTCDTGSGSTISGLAFAPSNGYPSQYAGALFLADRLRNCIWALPKDANGLPNPAAAMPVITQAASPVDLRAGPGGDLFYADQDGGTIRRIKYAVGNLAPVAAIQAGPATSGPSPLLVNFSALPSVDPEGASLSYSWDLDGDGAFDDSTSAQPTFTFNGYGAHTVLVRVEDGQGLSDVAAVTIITDNTAPVPTINGSLASLTWAVGDTINFSGSATDAEDGSLTASRLTWSLLINHCPTACHSHALQDFVGVAGGSFVTPDHEYPSHLELRLTATDSLGVQTTTSVLIQPRTANLTFASSPSGLQVTVGTTTAATPFTRTVIVGSSNPVTTATPQGPYAFASWSDAGAQSHTVVAPSSNQTYTATFQTAPALPGLVAAYGFNEGSGTATQDASGNGFTGTINGATWTTQGKVGSALSFDGQNDLVTVADAAALDLTTGMTLEAWVLPTATSGVRDILIKEGIGVDIYNLYARNGSGRAEANVLAGGSNRVAASPSSLSTNVWTHIAGTYDGTTVRLYVNGTQVASTAFTGTIATSTGALRIGGNSLWGEYFQGSIDEVRVYNRALTATEIQTDMNTAVGTPPIDTTPPVVSNPQPAGTLAFGTAQTTLSVATNEAATCRYGSTAGTAYASLPNVFATTGGTTHTSPVTGLLNGGNYTYYVKCRDASNNANTTDTTISFSVAASGADTTPPTVSITAPVNGGTVAGVITITANASDNVGVGGVQFLLDGANLGVEDTTAPYSMSWDTTTLNGSHTISARARDVSGNTALAPGVGVAVTNNQVPPNFVDEVVIGSGVTFPTAFDFLPDGRMLISEFTGRITIVQPGASVPDATPVLQLTNFFSEDVTVGGERGLVNVIADPGFATNGYIYLFYTAGSPQRDRVSRFTMVGDTASLSTEFVVWQAVANSTSTDHHGGGLGFGPDDKLYISTGDNGEPSTVQQLTSDHGKILRVNKDGTVPTDNPFYDGNGGNIDAIWARGLRNPFRFSFDAPTGRMYIGDVGLISVEEVNLGVAGANYGWPTCEGPCGTTGMTNPLFSYSRIGPDSSVTGGFVYRGTQFPAAYQGVYFYGDFAQNWIKYLTLNAAGQVTGQGNFLPADGFADGPYDPVMLKQSPDGSLYYVDFGWGWQGTENPASIRRIKYVAGNQPPAAMAAATPTNGPAPLSVSFSSAGSVDPEGQPLSYAWTFGDGGTSTQANPTHVYSQPGPYTVQLTVSDGTTSTSANALLISAGTLPVGTITSPANGTTFRAGDVINFSGTATDAEDGTLTGAAMTWTVVFHHDTHVHPAVGPISGTTSGSFTIQTSGHDFSGNTSYEIILNVRDSHGLQSTSSVTVVPQKVNLTFATNPSGLAIAIDGVNHTTPYVHDTLVGFQHVIDAPAQASGTSNYTFSSWSDAGAQSHTIVVPTTPQGYTATFAVSGPPPPPPGLVAGYAFNEGTGSTTLDVSGNNFIGTISGATWSTQGKFGNALSFDGVNDLVSVADAAALDLTTGMTVAAWVFPTATTGVRDILIKEGTGVDIYNLYARNGSGLPEANIFSGGTNRTAAGSSSLTANVWSHVAGTYDGTTVRLYVNGVQVGSVAVTGSIATSTGALRIGGNNLWGEYFQGRIDEVRVYNRALTANEINTDMNTPLGASATDTTPPVVSNPQPTGTLPAGTTQATLSVATSEAATCRYGPTAGTAYASLPTVFTTTGGTAHSSTLTGLTNGGSYTRYVRCQDTAGNPTTSDTVITFSVATVTDTTPPVVNNPQPTGTLPAGTTQATLSVATNEAATCRYGPTAGTAYASLPTAFTTTGGTAHSSTLTGLTNGGSYTRYVRCQDTAGNPTTSDTVITFSVATATDTTPPVVSNPQPTGTLPAGTTQATLSVATNEAATCRYGPTAGTAYASLPTVFTTTGGTAHSSTLTGLTDGGSYTRYVRCQDTAGNPTTADTSITFSVASVGGDMTAPTVAMTAPAAGNVSGTVTVSATASDNVAVVGVQFLVNGSPLGPEDTTAPYSFSWNSTGVANGPYQLSARARDAANNQTTAPSVGVTVNNSTSGGLVAAYGFNENTGATAASVVGGLNGTLSGATWTTLGRFGNALTFDGINDWVTVADANALDLTTAMTLEAWVYPTTAGDGAWRDVLIKERTNGEVYNLYSNAKADEPAVYVVRAAQTNAPREVLGTAALPLNAWSHLAVTYDGTTVRLYVNGVQVGTRAVSGALLTSTGALRIGGNSIWGEFFQGRIDEVRIYNRALSVAEIQADLNGPVQP